MSADPATRERARYRDALRSRDFRLLVAAFLVDQIGSWAYSVVIVVYIFDRTHSPTWLAAAAASRWLPGLLVGPYAGLVADRFERTRLMVVLALGSTVLMGAIAVVVSVNAPLVALLAVSAVAAIFSAPYRPAAGAVTPEVVDERHLAAANSLLGVIENVTVVLGPALGGLLLLTGRPVTGVAVNALSFVVAAVLVSRVAVRSRGGVAEEAAGVFGAVLSGVRTLVRQRDAFVLVGFCALDSAIYGASTVIYAPLSHRLGTGTDGYSYLLAGASLGSVLAAGIANRLSASRRLALVILVSLCCQALPFLVTVVVHAPAEAFLLQAVSGAGMIVVDVLALTAIQREIAGAVLSRVLGAFDSLVLAGTLAASFLFAGVYSLVGLDGTLAAIGIGFPVLALLGAPLLVSGERATAQELAALAPKVDLLASLELFAGASRASLESLARDAVVEERPAGSVLMREGEEARDLWVLVSGALAVSAHGEEGVDRSLPDVTAPGYVGELGVLRHAPRTATVTVREPALLWRLSGPDFLAAFENVPPSVTRLAVSSARLARTHPQAATEASLQPAVG